MINEWTIGMAIGAVVILVFFGGAGWLWNHRKGNRNSTPAAGSAKKNTTPTA